MTTYTIKPGIAALVEVVCDEFPLRYGERSQGYVFLAKGKPVDKGISTTVSFDSLPVEVQAAINAHFDTVFAMPIEARCKYMKTVAPWEVTV